MTTHLSDQRLTHFRQKFGQPHLDLAYHAAFPIALTPDLLYRLWAYFRCDVHGQPLQIPWVAVADLILAPFCREVGCNLYEIDGDVREILLHQLKDDPRFGPQRLQELANFLLAYHPPAQLQADDPDVRELAQIQRWVALGHSNRANQVVYDLARTLKAIPSSNGAEWSRMAALLRQLQLPGGEAEALLHYAHGMATLAHKDPKLALSHFQELPGSGQRNVKVAEVTLTIPEVVRSQIRTSPTRTRRWLLSALWVLIGILGAGALLFLNEKTPAHLLYILRGYLGGAYPQPRPPTGRGRGGPGR